MFDKKSTLTFEAEYGERLSRLFIFRGLWMFVEVWILWVWAIWFGIVSFVQFWYMLILGRRSKALFEKQLRFYRHLYKWNGYLNALVDQRPKFIED